MTASRSQLICFFDIFALFLLAGFSCYLGYDSLRDLDLGWHLAGGLWMIEHGAVPGADFLGAEGRPWIAYSWLAELVYAVVYRVSGFAGLQHLQFLTVFAQFAVLYRLAAALRESTDADGVAARITALLLVVTAIPLLAPLSFLRPQILSVIFLAIALRMMLADRSFAWLFLLTAAWANVHVFWIFAPLTFAVLNVGRISGPTYAVRIAFLTLAGLVSPYGPGNMLVIAEYAFGHGAGYGLIREFFPLAPDLGFIFWYFLAAVAVVFLLVLRRSAEPRLLLLALLCSAAAILQRKYLPFSSVAMLVLAARSLPPLRVRLRQSGEPRGIADLGAGALIVVLAVAAMLLFTPAPPLSPEDSELLTHAKALKVQGSVPAVVLSEFDDGGRLGLALYLNREAASDSSRFKTAIDGRTLVMGSERLRDFGALRADPLARCDVIRKWRPGLAVFSKASPILAAFKHAQIREDESTACFREWALILESDYWSIFQHMIPDDSALQN